MYLELQMTNFNLSTNLSQAFIALNKKIGKGSSYSFTNNAWDNNIVKLSKFQYEVLFLLVLGKSVREIAMIMTQLENKRCSSSIVRWMIDHLYLIFEVNSISELIEKAIIMRAVTHIPPTLID
jgi:hypothetical protein